MVSHARDVAWSEQVTLDLMSCQLHDHLEWLVRPGYELDEYLTIAVKVDRGAQYRSVSGKNRPFHYGSREYEPVQPLR